MKCPHRLGLSQHLAGPVGRLRPEQEVTCLKNSYQSRRVGRAQTDHAGHSTTAHRAPFLLPCSWRPNTSQEDYWPKCLKVGFVFPLLCPLTGASSPVSLVAWSIDPGLHLSTKIRSHSSSAQEPFMAPQCLVENIQTHLSPLTSLIPLQSK